MQKIREYEEGMPVEIVPWNDRYVVKALVEKGFRACLIDLGDIIKWTRENKPQLLS